MNVKTWVIIGGKPNLVVIYYHENPIFQELMPMAQKNPKKNHFAPCQKKSSALPSFNDLAIVRFPFLEYQHTCQNGK